MDLSAFTIGFGITGSFCTLSSVQKAICRLVDLGATVIPIFSYNVQNMDTRFGDAKEFIREVELITGNKGILTIQQAEPVGPKKMIDIMVIAPCTGNTAAKLWSGIVDTPVLMAAKSHLRNGSPLVIGLATNDGLGNNFKTLGNLMNLKNIYFVPLGQDDWKTKPNSLVSHMDKVEATIEMAMKGLQIQPVLEMYN